MIPTILQLRIAATRDKGFLFRATIRPPFVVTVGSDQDALLPLDAEGAPQLHTWFTLGHRAALLEFRPGWDLVLYRDDEPVDAATLLREGAARLAGGRAMMQLASGSRGSWSIGGVRLLFKWEEVADDPLGDVPIEGGGALPKCRHCGLSLRDVLVRDGFVARCDACRAVTRFVAPPNPQDAARAATSTPGADSQRIPTVQDESDTLLGVPIFAPTTRNALAALPELERPAGLGPRPPTPAEMAILVEPVTAAETMRTVLDAKVQPKSAAPIDDAFFSDAAPEVPEAPRTIGNLPATSGAGVPWRTMTTLSARSEYQDAGGRVAHSTEDEAGASRSRGWIWAVAVVLLAAALASRTCEAGSLPYSLFVIPRQLPECQP